MTDSPVLVRRDGTVATIVLNRPERRNALTVELKAALLDAVLDVAGDTAVRAVVLASSGPAFSVGQDLAEHAEGLRSGSEEAFGTVREHYSPVVRSLLSMPKPVIAAVSGACVGAGLGLALACDYRVFGEGVKLGTAFSGIGLTFDSGLSVTLPRAIGDARTRELMLFSRLFTAEEGITWGIAGETVAGGDGDAVLGRAVELATQLAAGPTQAFAQTKKLLLKSGTSSLDEALEAEAEGQIHCGRTRDHVQAVEAFLSRAKPDFQGE
ncbi:enoyl-CoA hydratase/isomerase family protein [Arthrobacter sp. NPDC090010]|uniref:enoyl-CoA hydratase/isomerase family protein n=1 Tax=Arthrobacter sp. NPDC090010 TaxID=3363942 RepID=UPI00380223E8